MKYTIGFLALFSLFISCNTDSSKKANSSTQLKDGEGYQLFLNPEDGSVYRYTVSNKTETSIEVNEKEVVKENISDMQIVYKVARNEEGDVLLGINYEKIKIVTKNGDEETEMDADNASFSVNTTEKLLGALKESKIDVALTSKGVLKSVNGFKELTENVFSKLSFPDEATKSYSREQWNKTIESGLVKQNIDQFFKIFPDSTIRLRQKWQLENVQKGEINLRVKTTYFMKSITDKYVYIDANSEIVSDSMANDMSHLDMNTQLKGEQSGEYVLERKTGMLVSAKLTSSINGNVLARNTEVPVKIKSVIKIEGKKPD